MRAPRAISLLAVLLFQIAFPRVCRAVERFPSLSAMARLEAEERLDAAGASSLSRGYLAYGLGPEAAASLERRIRQGELPREVAPRLFETIVSDRRVRENLAHLVGICETVERNRIRSPRLSLSCGTALRMTGRLAEATDVLARIGPNDPYRAHALHALGQISVERGDFGYALEIFKRVAEAGGSSPADPAPPPAVRAQADLLLLMGRAGDASKLHEELPASADLLERAAAASAARDPGSALESLPAEWIAAQPLRTRILFLLLKGGIERDQGRFAAAIADLTAADELIGSSLASDFVPPSGSTHRRGTVGSLDLLIGAQEALRRQVLSRSSEDLTVDWANPAVELLAGLLVLDHRLSLAIAADVPAGTPADPAAKASGEAVSILRRIERIMLEEIEQAITILKWDSVFWDIDRFAGELGGRTVDLPPLGHPVQRNRLLARLEKSQAELHRARERLRNRRDTAASAVDSAGASAMPAFLRDFGLYLKELHALRTALDDAREFTRSNARVQRQKKRHAESWRKVTEEVAKDTSAFSGERMKALLSSIRMLEGRERAAESDRTKRDLARLRPLVRRQLADARVAHARSLLADSRADAQREFWTAVDKAASLLAGGGLDPPDRFDTAIHVGSLLAGWMGRREAAPGQSIGEKEKILLSSVLPILDSAARTGSRREESLYLIAILRWISGDAGARSAARAFLERYPASPLAAGIAVRLGHAALAGGDLERAEGYYNMASGAGTPAATAIARHMLGWIRYRRGDPAGALKELGPLLAGSSFSCDDPAPFEKDVLSLSVLALRDSPAGDLASFPPVREGTCGGRRLLLLLGESEAARGNPVLAVAAFDALSRRYPEDEAAPAIERKAIEELVRAGREREAMTRALPLRQKYGEGSRWAKSQTPSVRKKVEADLAELIKSLSERMFAEGIRSGDRSAMSLAAAGLERYIDLAGEDRGEPDGETRLKWAIASLKSGEREGAVGILLELMGEGRGDDVGERAALLYGETMIAAYERNERTADEAEEAVYLLLGNSPSGRGAALAFRAASDFLGAEEYGRAAGISEEIEACASAPEGLKAQARLILAESAYFRGETAAALRRAETVLERGGTDLSPDLLLRARELYLLAAHREIEGKMAARDWNAAGEMLERLGGQFLDRREAPPYYLNALRSYRQAGNEEAVLRVGLRFLGEFPAREESVEVIEAVGPYLQARREFARAADLYEKVATAFPGSALAPRFLFHAARLSEYVGHRDAAMARFSACRSRYSEPRWISAYASLAIGAMKLEKGDAVSAIRELEEGVRRVAAGLEADAPGELVEMTGKARIAIGENWADQFRSARLVVPLEKSLAVKERLFRQALAAFETAAADAPLDVALTASRRAADLLVEFGKSILDSQRPKGMGSTERTAYDEALKKRAHALFERAFARYAGALELLAAEKGGADLAGPIRDRLEEVQVLLSMASATVSGGSP